MRVKIRTLQNKEVEVDVLEEDFVAQLKTKIQTAIPAFEGRSLRVIYAGNILNDEKTMNNYKVKEGCTLVVMGQAVTPPVKAPTDPVATNTSSASAQSTDTAEPCSAASTESSAVGGEAVAAPVDASCQPVAAEAVEDSSSSDGSTAGDGLVGSETVQAVEEIISMGFPRADVEVAMRVAFFNPDRAVEYLTTGIPPALLESEVATADEDATPPVPTAPVTGSGVSEVVGVTDPGASLSGGATAGFSAAGLTAAAGHSGSQSALHQLRSHPNFCQMRRAIQANPMLLPQFLSVISQQNPRLAELIVQNQTEFLQLLSGEDDQDAAAAGAGDDETEGPSQQQGVVQIQLSPEEIVSIGRLEDLGFPRAVAVQAYIACDKNEELAANYLFDNIGDFAEADA